MPMLRTNLSTRPFYNESGVHRILGATAVLVVVLTIFNLTQVVMLYRRQAQLGQQASDAETRARDLRAHAVQSRQALDAAQVAKISTAAREVNGIIGQRLFSWTELLNQLETTLPDDVRITALRPRAERTGSVTIQMTVTGRSVDDIAQFMANLEETAAFSDVFPREDDQTDDGLVQALVEGKYAIAP